MTDFDKRVLELARLQESLNKEIQTAEVLKHQLYLEHIQPLEMEIEGMKTALEDAEQSLRDDFLSYVQETGDVKPHPALTFYRRKKLMYDKDEVLQQAIQRGATNLLRVKPPELDVRAFEAAWKADEIHWADVEQVPAPFVTIGRLGDLIITHGSK